MYSRACGLLGVTVLACFSNVQAQVPPSQGVTLVEVLQRARENPPAVLVAVASLGRARAEHAVARAAYAPTLTLEASSGLAYDNRELTPNKIVAPESVPPEQREAYEQTRTPRYEATSLNSQGRANLELALIDVARRHRVEAASESASSQAGALDEVRRTVLATAAQLYFEGLAAGELVSDAQLSHARRLEQAQAIGALVGAGLRPTVDATRAQIEVVAARYGVETREIEERSQLGALAVALGDAPARPLALAPFDDSGLPAPLDPELASEQALGARPEVRAREHALAARQAELRVATSERLPTLGLRGSGDLNHASILSGTGIEGFSYLASGSLFLRWGVLDVGVRRRAEVARAAVEQARHELAQSVLTIRAEVFEAAYAVQRTRALLAQATEVLTGARSARTAQNQRYRAGLSSLLDLLDVEAIEQTARRQRIEAERDHRVARARLLAVSGSLEQLGR